jgi:uncharacterized protein YbjT (DUF2867 family)
MILITGADGKTGRAVVAALAKRDVPIRALVRYDDRIRALQALGATEVVAGDLRNETDLRRACRGVDAVYLICPNMQSDEFEIAQNVLHTANGAGVRRMVYHSVLHPQTEAMPHHWQKLRVEEWLFTLGFDYTILQPAAYMQNVLAQWSTIAATGVYRVPYAAETRLGMVDLHDVADAAASVLSTEGHSGATYELCGPEMLTQHEIAAILAQVLERPIRAEAQPRTIWRAAAAASGLSEYALNTLVAVFEYYELHGFGGNANVLTMLLGRRSTTFADSARRVVNT